ncbi:MAG TPA: hypothetical protein PLV92_05540 [Pirellulaceae bacterium]|nr:hypothetical protein [Pirellulaceae bacterium]
MGQFKTDLKDLQTKLDKASELLDEAERVVESKLVKQVEEQSQMYTEGWNALYMDLTVRISKAGLDASKASKLKIGDPPLFDADIKSDIARLNEMYDEFPAQAKARRKILADLSSEFVVALAEIQAKCQKLIDTLNTKKKENKDKRKGQAQKDYLAKLNEYAVSVQNCFTSAKEQEKKLASLDKKIVDRAEVLRDNMDKVSTSTTFGEVKSNAAKVVQLVSRAMQGADKPPELSKFRDETKYMAKQLAGLFKMAKNKSEMDELDGK